MASLAHALRSFHSGVLSREELYAEVDSILDGGRTDQEWLIKTLDEENTKVPLPPDVHKGLKSRIEKSAPAGDVKAGNGRSSGSDEVFVDPDQSRTRLATHLFHDDQAPAPNSQAANGGSPSAADQAASRAPIRPEFEQVKGTGDILNDRFVLEECIGSGGMSTVYKALDRRKLEADDRNPYVAVKVLNVEFRAHPDSLMALQREAKKSQSLAHPKIVRVYDFDRDGSTVYMTMEYLPGKSLAQILRAPGFKGMPPEEACRILTDAAKALAFAHDCGIVHADFKPANVILGNTGQVKVIDFGIARAFQRPDQTDMEATRFDPGSLGALTPTYASPEMLEHREPDPRDDIYALACIAYEMFTGRHPFGRMQATEARDGGLEVDRRNLSRREWKALKSALDFDRDKRTSTVRRFIEDFKSERTVSLSVGKAIAASAVILVIIGGIAGYQYLKPWVEMPSGSGAKPKDVEQASLQLGAAQKSEPAAKKVEKKPERPPTLESKRVQKPESEPPKTEKLAKVVEPKPVKPPAIVPPPTLKLASVLAITDKLPCSALNVSVRDGVVNVRGFTSGKLDVRRLEKDLASLPGAKRVTTSLQSVGNEQCAVVDLYAPYWSLGAGGSALVQTQGNVKELTEGDPLVVKLVTPPYESYVNVDYFSLDGGVVHMLPSPRAENNRAPANYAATLGDLGEWTVSGPFGTELIAVLNTPRPLFGTMRAEYETSKEYLAAVQKRLKSIARDTGKDKITADFVVIKTRPKSKPLLERVKEKALGGP